MTGLIVAALVTAISAPLVLRAMRGLGVLDVPSYRSSHVHPTARGGGLACLAGVAVAVALAASQGRPGPVIVLVDVGALAAIGLADDLRGLSAPFRFTLHLAAGAAMGLAVGGVWWIVIATFLVPLVVNTVNFMDGINGITGLTLGLWGVTALAIGHDRGLASLSLVGGVTAGAALGFLPWNLPRARLFLGDSGSYLFGGLASAGLLIGWAHGAPVVLLASPLFIYVADVLATILRRAHRREPLLEAHRQHVYQRLANEGGCSHSRVAALVGVLSAAITFSWLVAPAVISLAFTVLVLGAYLAAPSLVAQRERARRFDEDATP